MAQDLTGPLRARPWGLTLGAAVLYMFVVGAARFVPPRPSLFGVLLQTATRATLGRALLRAHLTLAPRGRHRWYNLYDVNGALKHARKLAVSYTSGGRFVKAVYTFPSFVSTRHFSEVLKMVTAKYGPPTHMSGQASIGRARAHWNLPYGFEIIVKRRWPNPTTYLVIENRLTLTRMKAEQRHVMAHSGAF